MPLSSYGQEMLALMQAHPWGAPILDLVHAHSAWTPLLVFLFAFGESLAIIGAFIPATVVLVAIGALVGASGIEGSSQSRHSMPSAMSSSRPAALSRGAIA